jgi:hypothetical protein
MSDMVKIGMTNRDTVEIRMKELFSTSVPLPFECEYACKAVDCEKVEKALHIAFQPYRIHAQREFFKINPEQAIAILKLLDKSNDITTEIVKEINDDLTEIDKVASENFKRKMRPPLNFKDMNIPTGAKLVFVKDENAVEVEVFGDRKILYNGNETSLTAVTKELLGLDYAVQPTRYWVYAGRNLQEIYNETYSEIE